MPAQPGGSATGARLAAALLAYFLLVIGIITLSPFDFAPRPLYVYWGWTPSDFVANVAMFVPLGFLLRTIDHGARFCAGPIAIAALFSGLIEFAQIFIVGRYVSPVDVAANTSGAVLGAIGREWVERWAVWHPRTVGRIGLDIPLVGLLYLLVPQLWLNGVALVDDPYRSMTTLLLGGAGAVVLVSLRRYRWQGGMRLAARVVPPTAFVWFAIGALPALAAAPGLFVAIATGVVLLTAWLLRPDGSHEQRRFESETLQRFLPVFLAYVVMVALWPPFRPLVAWHGALTFVDRLQNAGVMNLMVLLEQVGAFTLLGYAAAEWRSRRELSLARDLPLVTAATFVVAIGLEAVQGILVGPGASLARALLSTSGAAYGAVVYHLARAHVRALRTTALLSAPVQDGSEALRRRKAS